jgi:hypothetical protein
MSEPMCARCSRTNLGRKWSKKLSGLLCVPATIQATQECGGYRKQRREQDPLPPKPAVTHRGRARAPVRSPPESRAASNNDVSALVGAYIPRDDGATEVCDLGQALGEQGGKGRSARAHKPICAAPPRWRWVQPRSGRSFDSKENNPDNSRMRLRIPIHTKATIAA